MKTILLGIAVMLLGIVMTIVPTVWFTSWGFWVAIIGLIISAMGLFRK